MVSVGSGDPGDPADRPAYRAAQAEVKEATRQISLFLPMALEASELFKQKLGDLVAALGMKKAPMRKNVSSLRIEAMTLKRKAPKLELVIQSKRFFSECFTRVREYKMVNEWSNKSKSHLNFVFPIYSLLLIVLLVSGISGLISEKAGAQPQVPGQPQELDIRQVTLKLGGQSCDVNSAESAVLHLQGVLMVDIETRKGYLVVSYDSSKVSIAEMLSSVANRRGEDWFCQAEMVVE